MRLLHNRPVASTVEGTDFERVSSWMPIVTEVTFLRKSLCPCRAVHGCTG